MKLCAAYQRTVRLAVILTVAFSFLLPSVSSAQQASKSTRQAPKGSSSTTTKSAKKPAAKRTTARKTTAGSTTKKKSYASSQRSRASRLAAARAAARAKAERELATPRFKIDELGREVPDVRAEAAIIYNPETNEVLWESNAQEERSIASITKVMTAIVFLESGMPLSTETTIQRADVYRASTTYLRAGYKVTAEDLLNLLLIGSDNAAARALARMSPYGSAGFIDKMNEKAVELGLEKTHYADPSGLLATNISSAYDMARLIAYASADERIGSIMRKASHTVHAGRQTITVKSTNHLVREGQLEVLGGKTGFISRAGYCLATLLRLPDTGQRVAVVVLGAQSNQGRFWETRHLFNWLNTHTQKLFGVSQTTAQQQNDEPLSEPNR
jgi:D-alanyl-D-alanine endopeptidase (penicillin-binding protein 7)